MFQINENYLKLPGSYLFSTIGKKVKEYANAHKDKEIIRLGIGDVTLPLAPVVIQALHSAVDEMGKAETFKGYAPELGYEFLRQAIVDHDYKKRGAAIEIDEVFISDGVIQEILGIYLGWRIRLLFVIPCIQFILIVMLCLAGQEIMWRRLENGIKLFICHVQLRQILHQNFQRKLQI